MATSKAVTVEAYLEEMPPERRAVMAAVRQLVRENLPAGYEESMRWGMITYEIPLERHPDTYNGAPLGYVALAAQKNHYALYLMGIYADPAEERKLRESYAAAGKKLDMGKSCLRFKRLEQLETSAVARAVASMTPDRLIEIHQRRGQ